MNKEEKKEIIQLVKDVLKEMKKKQNVLLERGDLVPEEYIPHLKKMYDSITSLKNRDWKDKKEFVRYKDKYIFEPNESFFFCLFDTHQFPKLFELYDYE